MLEDICLVATKDAPQAIGPYSQAVAAGPYLFLSGQIPLNPQMGTIVADDIESQTHQVIDNIEAILAAKGLSLASVVRTEVYLKDMRDLVTMNTVYADRFKQAVKPARTTIQAAKLPLDCRIEITCIAYCP